MCHSHRRNAYDRGYAPAAAYGPYGPTDQFVCTNCYDGYVCRDCRHRRRRGCGGCGQAYGYGGCCGCGRRRCHGHCRRGGGGPIGLVVSLIVMGVKGVQNHREKKRIAREIAPESEKGKQVDTRSAPQIADQSWDVQTVGGSSRPQMREVKEHSSEKRLRKEETLPSYDSAVAAKR